MEVTETVILDDTRYLVRKINGRVDVTAKIQQFNDPPTRLDLFIEYIIKKYICLDDAFSRVHLEWQKSDIENAKLKDELNKLKGPRMSAYRQKCPECGLNPKSIYHSTLKGLKDFVTECTNCKCKMELVEVSEGEIESWRNYGNKRL